MAKVTFAQVANEAIADAVAEREFDMEQAIIANANTYVLAGDELWTAFHYADMGVRYNMSYEEIAHEDAILWDDMRDC